MRGSAPRRTDGGLEEGDDLGQGVLVDRHEHGLALHEDLVHHRLRHLREAEVIGMGVFEKNNVFDFLSTSWGSQFQ